jgi:hypothetical protein
MMPSFRARRDLASADGWRLCGRRISRPSCRGSRQRRTRVQSSSAHHVGRPDSVDCVISAFSSHHLSISNAQRAAQTGTSVLDHLQAVRVVLMGHLASLTEAADGKGAAYVAGQLLFGLRLGTHPRWLVTTTPKPIRLLRELLAREGQDVAVTRGSTFDNRDNLAPSFIEAIRKRYEGTRLGRQELHAEMLSDAVGALWNLRIDGPPSRAPIPPADRERPADYRMSLANK